MSQMENVIFAAVGDVHGQMHTMLQLLQTREKKSKKQIDFVLQVGDFEAHRHHEDLATMAAPSKYRSLGDFPNFYTQKSRFPWPVYFIGGNHEPYGLLDSIADGGEICPNCLANVHRGSNCFAVFERCQADIREITALAS